jgi:hypothetical protein
MRMAHLCVTYSYIIALLPRKARAHGRALPPEPIA